MYSRNVVVGPIDESSYYAFHKRFPIIKTIGLSIDDKNVASFLAVEKVNRELPVHECVSKVVEVKENDDSGDFFSVKVSIFD